MFDDIKDTSTQPPTSGTQQNQPPVPNSASPAQARPPQGLPVSDSDATVVEDIMADTDTTPASSQPSFAPQPTATPEQPSIREEMPSPSPARPVVTQPMPGAPMQWDDASSHSSVQQKKRLLLIGIFLIVALLLVIGGYVAYQQNWFGGTDALPESDNMLDDTTGVDTEPVDQEPIVEESVDTTEPDTTLPADIGELIDTDGDGLSDTEERTYGTDPELPDTDADGLFDREEVVSWKTDPLNPDTDGDTYLDGDEVQNGYDPRGDGRLDYFNQLPQN